VPDDGAAWPATDPHDSLYQRDLRHAMRLGGSRDMMMMSMPTHGAAHHGH